MSTLVSSLNTTVSLQPAEILHQGIDRNYRRSIEHTALLYVSAIIEHGRNLARSLAQHIILHDDDGNTSHREVLLSTCIDSGVLGNIYRTAHDV